MLAGAEDHVPALDIDALENRWWQDPVLKGAFPADLLEVFRFHRPTLPKVRLRDLALMSRPLDFLGVDYYFLEHVRWNGSPWPFCAEPGWVEKPRTDRGSIIRQSGYWYRQVIGANGL